MNPVTKEKVEVVQAVTSHYYHVVPSELARVTMSPEKGRFSNTCRALAAVGSF
jgi:hypothetical protein